MLAISVIIPVYRDWERLRLCLEALERQTLPASEWEIIVADNEPEGGSSSTRLPVNARIVHEPRPGSYAARNAAVALALGEHLAFTDSDCIPDPAWLENGLAALRSRSGARITGPVVIFREPGSHYLPYLYDLHTAFPQQEYVRQGHCATANLLVARRTFDQVGKFDECLSGGDSLWNMRAASMGVPILYDPGVSVGHPARRSLSEILRKRRRVVGSLALRQKVSLQRFALSRLTPPVRRLLALRRANVGLRESILLFLIIWFAQLAEAREYALVRLGMKSPNRT
ncbi:glycosyltransferase family 2 protein [Sphingosinicella sp. CPCC 101087]|uniref:glycosyltransferase family 2 protein n=1 Tax=Sphingosinicella sp. CPCC 101087 TaxID=2497754 RepID=UPI00101D7F01|nr:glycosyltransferase [Sphingosinicella sp. CPCC 101087]